MKKFCIFCGTNPADKTKEHILPKWLLEMTGGLNRVANLGMDKSFGPQKKHRVFSFGQFTFPACNQCNNNFSKLENEVKGILSDVLNEKKITGYSISRLMNWFDKIRIGLWLGMIQLDENYLDIDPKFHIGTRVGQSDRLLIIEKSDCETKRLNLGGIDFPSFSITPSAFLLIVNNYYFTNISYPFLFSCRLGFPYPTNTFIDPNENRMGCDFAKGKERIMRPILRKRFSNKGIEIYQPMFKNGLVEGGLESYYSSQYVIDHSMDVKNGVGNIFIEKGSKAYEYNASELVNIQPQEVQNDEEIFILSAINISKWQNWLSEQMPSIEKLTIDKKKYIKARFRMAKKVNDIFIKHHNSLLLKYKKSQIKLK